MFTHCDSGVAVNMVIFIVILSMTAVNIMIFMVNMVKGPAMFGFSEAVPLGNIG
jgi:hypothetical protein